MNRIGRVAAALVVTTFSFLASAQRQTVIGSEHDLSTGAAGDPSVCTYCHVPHYANPSLGLWSHQMPTSPYNLSYPSTTYTEGSAIMATPSPSRLCMSCHDGTIGLGAENNATGPFPTSKTLSNPGANMGTDLRADHPQSFDNWNRNTVNPQFETMKDLLLSSHTTGNSSVKLWNARVECTTCHEPHTPNNDPNRPSKFLSLDNANGALCLVCHDVTRAAPNVLSGWVPSSHNQSTTTEGASVAGYPNVAQAACMNCHVPHRSGSDRLLRNGEEQACFACHAATGSQSRWAQVWLGNTDTTQYMHPVQATGHQPIEDLLAGSTPRHSECWDCHDAHAMKSSSPSGDPLQSSLLASTGLDQYKNPTSPAAHVYEVCFKCHADSTNKPQGTVAGYNKYGYSPVRQVDSHNTRLDFTSTLPRHNVVQPASTTVYPDYRTNVLRLDQLPGRSLGGNIECEDCHSGNNPTNDGGTGPNGPHISTYAHILERPYALNAPPGVSGGTVTSLSVPVNGGDAFTGPFALCNKCHDLEGLLGGTLPSTGVPQVPGPKDTVFQHHNTHVVQGGISCAVCHAPHGVNSNDAQHHTNLINLDANLTSADVTTGNWYIDTQSRTCYVTCHYSNDTTGIGVQHSGITYGSAFAGAARSRTIRVPAAPRK
jgi:predicted CXXCH cytochrome family protein